MKIEYFVLCEEALNSEKYFCLFYPRLFYIYCLRKVVTDIIFLRKNSAPWNQFDTFHRPYGRSMAPSKASSPQSAI
jgi:hypothetical protein